MAPGSAPNHWIGAPRPPVFQMKGQAQGRAVSEHVGFEVCSCEFGPSCPRSSCQVLGRSLCPSVPLFLICYMANRTGPTLRCCGRIEFSDAPGSRSCHISAR